MSVEVQKETAPKEKWFMMTPEDVAAKLSTSLKSGLTSEEAKLRLEKYGYNELKQKEKDPWWKRFLAEFNDFLVYILIVAALLSAIVEYIESSQHGEPTFGYDWIVIAVIVILNAIIGFVQEGKADAALEALKKMSAPEAQVIRDGKEISIKAREIVIGDIIVLHEGDMVPADGRIFEESNLKAEEAALTGESVPVTKRVSVISDPETPLAEMKNMVFSSTLVTFGRGQAIVTSTGMNTEVGKIATMIDEAEEKMTPLQESLEEFGGSLGKLILVICGVVALIYIIRSGDILGSILAGVALAVAAIPEGLPAVVTICLAIGVTSMAKKNAIVKKLHSVETLGCTTVICSDKTGTLTKNEMTVRGIWAGGKLYSVTGSGYEPEGKILLDQQPVDVKSIPDLEMTLRTGLLCNNARLSKEDKWKCFGDPTEGCLITSAWKAGLEREATYAKYPRINEIPFDSGRKRMTTINKTNGKEIAYVKGATEILLDFCKNIQWEGKIRPITDADKKEILKVNEEQASKALRGLGFAYRDATGIPAEIDTMEKDLTFVGMQFMIDPPRDEVKEAIKRCKSAGIDVKMITGDNLMTAVAIAEELDMAKRGDPAYQGKDIPTLSDDQINAAHVFARVSPEHKQNIVKALQNKNHIVAMTGDGVNDAPALKNANVGVAMGITGTEVSKEAAVMILADDNFATIVNAVEEGRGIYDNIKKFIQYLLSSNIMEVLVLLIAAIIGLPLPLLPIQLLWINLVTDGAPAIALGYDPYDPTLMQRKPRPVDEPILTKSFITTMIYRGIIMTVVVLGLFYLYDQVPPFMVTSFSQIDDAHLKLAIAYGLKPGQETEFFAAYNQLTPEQLAANYTAFLPGGIYENEILANGFEAYTEAHARSVCFLVMMFGEMANAFNCRSEFNSIFKIGLFTNKIMLYAVGISTLLTIALYIPGEWLGGINYLGRTFYVLYLEEEWLWVIPSVALVIGSVELIKIYFRKTLNLKFD